MDLFKTLKTRYAANEKDAQAFYPSAIRRVMAERRRIRRLGAGGDHRAGERYHDVGLLRRKGEG